MMTWIVVLSAAILLPVAWIEGGKGSNEPK